MEKLLTVRNDDSCLFTADSDFDSTEKAAHITKKFKESKKQSDLPQLPEFEDIPSSSSGTDSSWADRELKSLIKSKTIQCNNTKQLKKKKNKTKVKTKGNF